MDRPQGFRGDQSPGRQPLSRLVLLGIGVVLLFAVLGVISAGAFVADKVAGGSTATATPRPIPSGPSGTPQEIARAQAQATAIVSAAQKAGKRMMSTATTRANAQAGAIIAAARRQATLVGRATGVPAPTRIPAPVSVAPPPTQVPAPVVVRTPSTSSIAPVAPVAPVITPQPIFRPSPVTRATYVPARVVVHPTILARLGPLPSTWLVVAYNATFGRSPGRVGTISVTNRSNKTFSGIARVTYAHGGVASAPFSGLVPGQTEILNLTGATYPGGGYHILIVNPH